MKWEEENCVTLDGDNLNQFFIFFSGLISKAKVQSKGPNVRKEYQNRQGMLSSKK